MTERLREINAITLSNVKREVESLKSEMRALRTGHLTATVARALWFIEISTMCVIHSLVRSISRVSRSRKRL